MDCIYCGKQVTKWQLFLGWFWKLPLKIGESSQIWEQCCSYKCYGLELERQLRSMSVDSREVLDLSDYLFLSATKFITLDELIGNIGKVQTTEWARHIVAAGYRKVAPNENPVDGAFRSRNK